MSERGAPRQNPAPPVDSRLTKSMLSSIGGRPPAFICRKETALGQLAGLKGHAYADAKQRETLTRENFERGNSLLMLASLSRSDQHERTCVTPAHKTPSIFRVFH